jgi:hypothetical protein
MKHEEATVPPAPMGQVDQWVRPAGCSSLCATDEQCSVTVDGKCIGWWPADAWVAQSDIAAAMDDKRAAMHACHALPEGSDARRVHWSEWQAAVRRQRAAEARFAALVAGGPNA